MDTMPGHYVLGMVTRSPGPPVPENTHVFSTAESDISVEYRRVAGMNLIDQGFTIHVMDGTTKHEYLRFDMFPKEPHYHYIKPDIENRVVTYDRFACGPMYEWVLNRLRNHLPEMLELAGADELATKIRTSDSYGAALEKTIAAIQEHIDAGVSA